MQLHTENPFKSLETQARANGISTNLLCKQAKVGRSTFTKGKNGSHSPYYSTIQRLEKALQKLLKQQNNVSNSDQKGNGQGN